VGLTEKIDEQVNALLDLFCSKTIQLGSFLFCIFGQFLDQLTTQINLNFLGCVEINPYAASIITHPIMIFVEIGIFSVVWLIPYNLTKITKHAGPLMLMGFVFGTAKIAAAIHNISLWFWR